MHKRRKAMVSMNKSCNVFEQVTLQSSQLLSSVVSTSKVLSPTYISGFRNRIPSAHHGIRLLIVRPLRFAVLALTIMTVKDMAGSTKGPDPILLTLFANRFMTVAEAMGRPVSSLLHSVCRMLMRQIQILAANCNKHCMCQSAQTPVQALSIRAEHQRTSRFLMCLVCSRR